MKCPYCRHEIPEGVNICPKCWAEVPTNNDKAGKPASNKTAKSKRKTMEG